MNQSLADDGGGSAVEYLRALKRSNQGLPPDPAFPAPEATTERRRNPRYKCEGSCEIYADGSTVRTWASLTDLSRSGCYLEMQATSPVGTPLAMLIEVRGIRFRVKGIVRMCYPFLGMGVAFAEISAEDQARFNELLLLLASSTLSVSAEGAESKPELLVQDISKIQDAQHFLKDVAAHFQISRTLTREEFLDLLARSSQPPTL